LLAASFCFVLSFASSFLIPLVISIFITFLISLLMDKQSTPVLRKSLLALMLIVNFGMLFVFKYFNSFSDVTSSFFAELDVYVVSPHIDWLLPIGISFYVLTACSYAIDVYKGKFHPERHLGLFALYLSFFPRLAAGPIVRVNELMAQFRQVHKFDGVLISDGLKLVIWGLFKKIVIADRLAAYVNLVYDHPSSYNGITFAVATFFFAFQIYCDFSGYVDVALGTAQILGFNLPDNFNRPYSSTSVREFWNRWHITLYAWLRDYVYIPLGGNRASKPRIWFNIIIVFVISGLWHGAEFTFLAWGLILGIFVATAVAFERVHTRQGFKKPKRRLRTFVGVCITFVLISFAWIFFRANSIQDALHIVSAIGSQIVHIGANILNREMLIETWEAVNISFGPLWIALSLCLLIGFSLFHYFQPHEGMRHMLDGRPIVVKWAFYYLLIIGIIFLGVYAGQTPFIYFGF